MVPDALIYFSIYLLITYCVLSLIQDTCDITKMSNVLAPANLTIAYRTDVEYVSVS